MSASLFVAYKHSVLAKESRFGSIFVFLPLTIVLLFSRWLMKIAVDIYLLCNVVQFFNVLFILNAFFGWLWI
jgi:hypothetical protein